MSLGISRGAAKVIGKMLLNPLLENEWSQSQLCWSDEE
jgi:hypothetical protein